VSVLGCFCSNALSACFGVTLPLRYRFTPRTTWVLYLEKLVFDSVRSRGKCCRSWNWESYWMV